MTRDKAINILASLTKEGILPSWDDIHKAAKFACDMLSASPEDGVHIQFNDERTFKKEQPQGLDEAALYWDDTHPFSGPLSSFKAGAKWMAGQGWSRELEVKEDAGGYPYIDKHIELYDYDTDEPLAKKGDKVVVQIRKK